MTASEITVCPPAACSKEVIDRFVQLICTGGAIPDEAKRILKRVVVYLEKIDYSGSIIYDEYPDQIGIYRIVASILDDIKRENEEAGMMLSSEKEVWMQDLIKLVLFQEIFRRRYERKNGYLKF